MPLLYSRLDNNDSIFPLHFKHSSVSSSRVSITNHAHEYLKLKQSAIRLHMCLSLLRKRLFCSADSVFVSFISLNVSRRGCQRKFGFSGLRHATLTALCASAHEKYLTKTLHDLPYEYLTIHMLERVQTNNIHPKRNTQAIYILRSLSVCSEITHFE